MDAVGIHVELHETEPTVPPFASGPGIALVVGQYLVDRVSVIIIVNPYVFRLGVAILGSESPRMER